MIFDLKEMLFSSKSWGQKERQLELKNVLRINVLTNFQKKCKYTEEKG